MRTENLSFDDASSDVQRRRRNGLSSADRRRQPFERESNGGLQIADETGVAVSTDWESITALATEQLTRVTAARPDIRTVLHLGDLRLDPDIGSGTSRFLRKVNRALESCGVERLLVTPGNHDDWERMSRWWTQHDEAAYRVASRIWFLRPGTRFVMAGRSILSFGGASAFDRAHQPWWPLSMPDPDRARSVAAQGPCDVLLTHEAVGSGIRAVRRVIDGPSSWPVEEIDDSIRSRAVVDELRGAVHPAVALHGHIHRAGLERTEGSLTVALAGRRPEYNAGFLDLPTLTWQWLEDAER
ncbi:metallophosphoesterase [Curtobacterium sp. NPDC089689]|uniref:metallophosphoesterase family protein n=1 Tax=Curtobacterium sp. NPDC089689 TaxID=3363968 RepID=UPI003804351A